MRFCVVANFIFLIICITLALLLNNPASSEETKDVVEIIYFIYGIFLDIVLAAILGYFGYNFGMKQKSNTVATRILPRSPMMFSYVNWMLVGVYIIRGITNLLAAIGQLEYFGSVEYNGDHPPTKFELVIYFFIVEIVPMVCILIVLWKRASRRKRIRNATLKAALLPDIESSRSRSGATSVDDQKVSVKFATDPIVKSDGPTDFTKTSAPPEWWTSMFSSRFQQPNYNSSQFDAPLATSAGEVFPPAMDEMASEDDYMMFRDNPQPRSEGGLQFSPNSGTLRIQSRFDSVTAPVSSMNPGRSGSSSGLSQNGSPLAAAGTPPSFDAWLKSQNTSQPQASANSPLTMTQTTVQPTSRAMVSQMPPQSLGTLPPRGSVSGLSMTLNYVPPGAPGMSISPSTTPSSMSTNMPHASYLGAAPSQMGMGGPRSRMSAASSSVASGSTDRLADPTRTYPIPFGPGMSAEPSAMGPRPDGAHNSLYLSQPPPELFENEVSLCLCAKYMAYFLCFNCRIL
jgi:hypothetical protein